MQCGGGGGREGSHGCVRGRGQAGRQAEGRVCRKIRREGRMLQASKAAG